MNIDKYIGSSYKMNDLSSVYTHYDPKTGKNVPTENKIKGSDNNGKNS